MVFLCKMKFTVILLLVVASHAAEQRNSKGRQKSREELTDKSDGNSYIDKRAPVSSTVAPSVAPGIQYADAKESQQEQSPAQQIYATPVPQIVKISDLLTGHGPQFQTAIANHLYSPVSVYQPRGAAPPAYEISQPIPSQLAYSEHKISYQQPPNQIQYAPQPQVLKQINFQRLPNYQPTYPQQILVQPQHPQHIPQPQPIIHQLPPFAYQQQVPQGVPQQYVQHQVPQGVPQQYVQQQVPQQLIRPVQYIQNPHVPPEYLRHQIPVPFVQAPQQLVQVPIHQVQQVQQYQQLQPGITYAQAENNVQQNLQQVQQNQEAQQVAQSGSFVQPVVVKELGPQQKNNIQQPNAYNQPQGAVSYASFSQSQPSNVQQKSQQYKPQIQYQTQTKAQQVSFQPLHTQIQSDSKENLVASQSKSVPAQPTYFRPGPAPSVVQQAVLPPVVPQGQLIVPNPGYIQQGVPVAPTFPPVQYFGKYAQSIFKRQYNS